MSEPEQPAFLAGGVRLPDPRLVEPLSIFRDAGGQIWQAVPGVAGVQWQPLSLVSDQVHDLGEQAVGRWGRYVWISLGATAIALIAALYLPLHPGLFGGGAQGAMVLPFVRLLIVVVPLVVTLLVIRRRRAYARVVDREVTPTTITLPTGAVERRR
jgi:hypothetical protein